MTVAGGSGVVALWIRLKHHWFRNLLAVLQVAVAIAAVSAVFVDVWPVLKPINSEASSEYVIRYGARSSTGVVWSTAFRVDDVDYLSAHATTLEAASAFEEMFQPIVQVDGERYMLREAARVHPSFARLIGLEIVAGRFFSEEDMAAGRRPVAVIEKELASLLFGDVADALGKTINLRPDNEGRVLRGFSSGDERAQALGAPGQDVEIVGVFTNPSQRFGDVPISPASAVMLMPVSQDTADTPFIRNLASIFVKVYPGMEREAEEEVKMLLTARLAERGQDERDIDGTRLDILMEPAAGAATLRSAMLMNGLIFGGLGVAALAVSSIAVFTTTMANLTQRTRYIGLSRAIGATRGRVVREVVAETALLAGIGGLLGVVLAFPLRTTLLAPLLGGFGGGSVAVGDVLWTALTGVGLAVVVGAVAGLYPAWTVARLLPAEAWREGTM